MTTGRIFSAPSMAYSRGRASVARFPTDADETAGVVSENFTLGKHIEDAQHVAIRIRVQDARRSR